MTPTLWHIELSHYNEKARWALDYKGIRHVRRAPLPGLHGPVAMAVTRSGHRKLPVLVLDGRRVADSTAIIAALEEYQPNPPLYPADPADRRRALEIEDYFDETLAPAVRRLNFHHSLNDPDLMVDLLFASDTRSWQAKALRPLLPLARPVVRRDYKIGGEELDRALDEIRGSMDRIERVVGPSGYMVGDTFSVADLTAAALFTPLMVPPERQYPPLRLAPTMADLREEMKAREGGTWVYEMFRRHRGVSAEVPA